MNSAIKTLEKIGQNTSLKQHGDLMEMLKSLNIQQNTVENINLKINEFVCALLPEDDEGENEDENG